METPAPQKASPLTDEGGHLGLPFVQIQENIDIYVFVCVYLCTYIYK